MHKIHQKKHYRLTSIQPLPPPYNECAYLVVHNNRHHYYYAEIRGNVMELCEVDNILQMQHG